MSKTAREFAYDILVDVLLNDAYSNISINKVFSKNNINQQDKKYITQLVYGSIQHKIYLEYVIKIFSNTRIKPKVKVLVLMSVYQILKLDKTPNFAAVNEAVNLSKKLFGTHTSKFVNAILRNIVKDSERIEKSYKNEEDRLITENSCPIELYNILKKQYGKTKANSIIKSFNSSSENSIRINNLKTNKDDLIKYFESKNVGAKESKITKDCLILESIDIRDKKFQEGHYIIQDEASALVAHTLSEDKDKIMKILDVCAAPGGKSLHIASLYRKADLISCDKYDHKLKLIEHNAKKLGIDNITVKEQDARNINTEFIDSFDVLICDVPCSGIGVIKNKPEIKYKITDDYVNEIADLQLEILEKNSNYLKVGGTLIYSTCTIDKRENEYNVQRFLGKNPNFKIDPISISSEVKLTEDGMISILPDEYNCDGFFICKLKKIK